MLPPVATAIFSKVATRPSSRKLAALTPISASAPAAAPAGLTIPAMLALIAVDASAVLRPEAVVAARAAPSSAKLMPAAAAIGPTWPKLAASSVMVVLPRRTVVKRMSDAF